MLFRSAWAVGNGGALLTTTNGGVSWTRGPQTSAAGGLTDVQFYSTNFGWIAGEDGMILQTANRGAFWIARSTRTDATLRALYFVNDKTGWAVGDNGTILYTVDGGVFWVKQFKR